MSERYGIYFMPADESALAAFGTAVLGRTASNAVVAAPQADYPDRRREVAQPARYGFHATLKAPFEPLPEVSADQLTAALQSVAGRYAAVPLTALAPAVVGGFCALVMPVGPDDRTVSGADSDTAAPLAGHGGRTVPDDVPPPPGRVAAGDANRQARALAGELVEYFEPYRAPLSDADRQRRQPHRLDHREREYLDRYGYPYVHETYRFHMTLSGPMAEPQPFLSWLQQYYAATVTQPCQLDRLALVWQPDRQTPFRRIAEAVLTGSVMAGTGPAD